MGLPPGDRVGLFTLNVVGNGINGGVALAAPECGGVEVDGYDRPAAGEGERITADPRAEVDHGFARRCSGLVEPGGFVSSDGLGGCLFEADAVEPHLVGAVELGATFAAEFGRQQGEPDEVGHVRGSTDMGNVSQVVPSIHPMLAVAPAGVSIHTPEFADHARSAAGERSCS